MAWLEAHPTSGHFKICFRFNGRKLKKTVKTTERGKADVVLARFQENLDLLERGRIELPPGADIGTFLLSDGKLTGMPVAEPPPPALTLGGLRDAYLSVHSNGAMEENSLDTARMHLRQITLTLGQSIHVEKIETSNLQEHIDRRSKKRVPRPAAESHHVTQGNGELSGLLELGVAFRQAQSGFSRSRA